ncbi:unnamed protein product [Echinostoma caproni]|uniref:CNH domain-containing protein n=1 Tax=Echinostoma caproni TaxID=27848 RepID=A0A3P8G406_9TREM|nr:unnamed protein product [Echinostoma caproni]
MSDRISEFGFRIHGSEGEEEEEEEDDEVDDYEFPEVNEENGIVIPDSIPSLQPSLQTPVMTTPKTSSAHSKEFSQIRDSDIVSEMEQPMLADPGSHSPAQNNRSHVDQAPKSVEPDRVDVAAAVNGAKVAPSDKTHSDPLQEFYPDKSGDSTVLPTTLSALANLQSTKISLNGTSEPLRPRLNEEEKITCPHVYQSETGSPILHHSEPPASPIDRVQSEPPPHSPVKEEMSMMIPALSEPVQILPNMNTFANVEPESNEIQPLEVIETSIAETLEPTIEPVPILLEPPVWTTGLHLDDVSAIDSDRSVQVSPVSADLVVKTQSKTVSSEGLDESGIQVLASPTEHSPDVTHSSDYQPTTARLSDIMGEKGSELEELESADELKPTENQTDSIPMEPVSVACPEQEVQEIIPDVHSEETIAVVHSTSPSPDKQLRVRSMDSAEPSNLVRESHTGSLQLLPITCTTEELPSVAEPTAEYVDQCDSGVPEETIEQPHMVMELELSEPYPVRVQPSDSLTERRTSFSRTYPPRPEINGSHQANSKALMSSSQVNSSHPLSRAAHLRESDTSQPQSGSSGSRSSRFSMIELSHVNERPLHASCSALPPTPQVHMGACFSLVFEGCPLKINSTATWINPMNNGMDEYNYNFPPQRSCQVILFGTNDGIYYLNLKDLADSSLELVLVPDMPSPLLTFDLFIVKERPLPLVCLGVYRHHSRRGRENQRYRLHLVDLNTCAPFSPTSDMLMTPGQSALTVDHHLSVNDKSCKVNGENETEQPTNGKLSGSDLRKIKQKVECERRNALFLPEDMLPVVEAVQLEHNTILVCLQDCAKVINLSGRIKSSRHRATTLDFNGNMAESVVCLRDSILVFHPNGLLGKSFTGEVFCIDPNLMNQAARYPTKPGRGLIVNTLANTI